MYVDFGDTCSTDHCSVIIFHGRILPRANVSIVATLQLALVGNIYDCACVYFRGGRGTMLSKSRGKPIYGRVTCNMLTIRISHFKIIYIIVTDPDDSTRRVWRRCDVYIIILSASTWYIMCVCITCITKL